MTHPTDEELDALERELWESDAASSLTNRAARAITALRAQLAAANARADRAEAAMAAQIEADAGIADDYTPEKHSGMTLQAHVTGRNIATAIRNQPHNRTALDRLLADAEALKVQEVQALVEVLAWYGEQARLCRLIHREGDAGRLALQSDGGGRAIAALRAIEEGEA